MSMSFNVGAARLLVSLSMEIAKEGAKVIFGAFGSESIGIGSDTMS